MIIIETNLKKIPKKCNKCKYSYLTHEGRFCAVAFRNMFNQPVPYQFNKEKKNWEYIRPEWCPLKEA